MVLLRKDFHKEKISMNDNGFVHNIYLVLTANLLRTQLVSFKAV